MADVSMSMMTGKGNKPGKTLCEKCSKPCNVDYEAKVQLCNRCKLKEYPSNCFNPRNDLDFWESDIKRRRR